MQNLEELGLLGLGSRLKRLSEILYKQSDQLFKSNGMDIQSRNLPLLQLLATHDTLSVTHLAELLGQTHPAISQMSKKLAKQGLVYHQSDTTDDRRRLLALTPAGFELVDNVRPIWNILETVLKRILDVSSYGLMDNMELLERELAKMSLDERVLMLKREQQYDRVEIVHFEPIYERDFYRLNRHWLDKHFYVESLDHEILSKPESHIIDQGGFVLLARLEGKIIGTAALIVGANNTLELSKMSVDEGYQGLGIGEKIARAAINQYRATDFSLLYLESNRKLLPALNLYTKLGFIEKPTPFQEAHYSRADIYMEFQEIA